MICTYSDKSTPSLAAVFVSLLTVDESCFVSSLPGEKVKCTPSGRGTPSEDCVVSAGLGLGGVSPPDARRDK